LEGHAAGQGNKSVTRKVTFNAMSNRLDASSWIWHFINDFTEINAYKIFIRKFQAKRSLASIGSDGKYC
jgi:hypothetical protein